MAYAPKISFIKAMIYTIIAFTSTTLGFMMAAGPYYEIVDIFNETYYDSAPVEYWDEGASIIGPVKALYLPTAAFCIMGSTSYVYLWATRKEYVSTGGYLY